MFDKNLNIIFKDVDFSYDGENKVLTDVSIDITENTFTGIVGESGSGKSTIAALIMGKHTLQDGVISIAGLNVSDISEDSLCSKVNYVGLGSTFFKGTVRENLLLAKAGASDEELWNVLKECNIDGFFREDKGLDSLLTENAGNLSGGQKQRLALARAILHDAKIYIFDEATSNIDVESEEMILEEIRELAKTKTVIMITHRLMNVIDADRIYCIKDGRITGKGTHSDLIEEDETYKELWNTQKELEEFAKGGTVA